MSTGGDQTLDSGKVVSPDAGSASLLPKSFEGPKEYATKDMTIQVKGRLGGTIPPLLFYFIV